MEKPQTDSKPLSKKKVLLIVALAVLTLSALGVAGYFWRTSLPGKEGDAGVLSPMDKNLPELYFPSQFMSTVDPSLKAPQTSDLKTNDWIGLIKYYNCNIQYNPSQLFEPNDLESIDSMKQLIIERYEEHFYDGTRVNIHLFYLEALCRLGKEKMALQIFDSVKNESFDLMQPYGAPVLLLSKIKGLLQADKVSKILYDAIQNPCIPDKEIIDALNSLEDFKRSPRIPDEEILRAFDPRRESMQLPRIPDERTFGALKPKKESMQLSHKFRLGISPLNSMNTFMQSPSDPDEETFGAFDPREEFLQSHSSLVGQAFAFNRVDLFKHLITELSNYWHEEKYSCYMGDMYSAIEYRISCIGSDLTLKQSEMKDYFLEVAKNHENFEDVRASADLRAQFESNLHQ